MQITDIRVRKIQGDGKMRGMASITIDDEFVVHDIKIIEGEKGFFIAMPSRRSKEGEFRDVAHPIKSETRTQLQSMILKAYEEAPDAAPGEAGEV
ncbi:MAG: septation regulator SpoVG [Eubacteriales bacterium]|nr:septation regulator SpoVG [Eubacteriales bacterium]